MTKRKVMAIRGDDGVGWGVGGENWLLYECDMTKEMAEKLAKLENRSNPPIDFVESMEIIEREANDQAPQ